MYYVTAQFTTTYPTLKPVNWIKSPLTKFEVGQTNQHAELEEYMNQLFPPGL